MSSPSAETATAITHDEIDRIAETGRSRGDLLEELLLGGLSAKQEGPPQGCDGEIDRHQERL
jgi:hypothetical protein